jgi:DNA repair protein RecO (recombination protein O)
VRTQRAAHHVEAIILRLQPYRDADLIVAAFSLRAGRIDALARGARSSQRRFGGHLGLLNLCELEVGGDPTTGETGRLCELRSARLLRSAEALGSAYERLALGSFAAEIALVAGQPGHADAPLFALLDEALLGAAEVALDALMPQALALQVGALGVVGAWPSAQTCVACGLPCDRGAAFEAPYDGPRCAACASRPGPLEVADLRLLDRMGTRSATILAGGALSAPVTTHLWRPVAGMLDRALGVRLRTRDALEAALAALAFEAEG